MRDRVSLLSLSFPYFLFPFRKAAVHVREAAAAFHDLGFRIYGLGISIYGLGDGANSFKDDRV